MYEAMDFFYKREVNKSVLCDGFGVEREYLNIFLDQLGDLQRGEKHDITLIVNGKPFSAEIRNLNNAKDRRKNDAYQIRYPANGNLAQEFQRIFFRTYSYIENQRAILEQKKESRRLFVKIPEEYKEYIAIYTTTEANVFLCEAIVKDDMDVLRSMTKDKDERTFEAEFNYDVVDNTAGIVEKDALRRIRKYNKKIGDMLKKHYEYRCQICGQKIGERYGSQLVEAHHIKYFVKSHNNDMKNLLIVCPNHHGIIHDKNPEFNAKTCMYKYPNGYEEGLVLNDHLK